MGFSLTDPGRYQNGTQDFSAQIAAFKRDGVEIVTGVVIVISLNESGISAFTLPITSTIFILIGSFIIGVIAAVFPAWRATRTEIITAIASA